MKPNGNQFQIWCVVILMGLFAGGLYTGHRQSGHWPMANALILASLACYAFLLVRRSRVVTAALDVGILAFMAALAVVAVILAAAGQGGTASAMLKVAPLLVLILYVGVVNVRRRRATLPSH